MPAQVNAVLTRVGGATAATGGRDDWDNSLDGVAGPEPAGAGGAKWTGFADAYLQERVTRTPGDAGSVSTVRALIVDSDVARAAGIDTDDVLTFEDAAGVERTARALTVTRAELDGIPSHLATTRLELEER
jgi:hypothetical protein